MVGKCGNETSVAKASRPKRSCIYTCGGGETRNFCWAPEVCTGKREHRKIVNDVRPTIAFQNFSSVIWRCRSARGLRCTIWSRCSASPPNLRNVIRLSLFIRKSGRLVRDIRMDLEIQTIPLWQLYTTLTLWGWCSERPFVCLLLAIA